MKIFFILINTCLVVILSGCNQRSTTEKVGQQTDQSVENSVFTEDSFEAELFEKETKGNYAETLKQLENATEKTDSNIYFKRGVCYFYLDNYQQSLINFRKDRELNGDKNDSVIIPLFEQMDSVIDEEDFAISEEIINLVVPDKKEQEKFVIKLYSSNNFEKRQEWFGYFKMRDKEIFVTYETVNKNLKKVTEEEFSKEFKEHYYASYKETNPIFTLNDPTGDEK